MRSGRVKSGCRNHTIYFMSIDSCTCCSSVVNHLFLRFLPLLNIGINLQFTLGGITVLRNHAILFSLVCICFYLYTNKSTVVSFYKNNVSLGTVQLYYFVGA